MDHIKTQLDDLTNLSDDQITELASQIRSEFEKVKPKDDSELTTDIVGQMSELAASFEMLENEVARREVEKTELAATAAEAASRFKDEELDGATDSEIVVEDTEEVLPIDPTEPEVEEPVDPTDPEPTDPVDPEPTDPVEPEPTDPVDPEPTDPEEPVETEPTDPVEPEPTDPEDPEDTEEVIEETEDEEDDTTASSETVTASADVEDEAPVAETEASVDTTPELSEFSETEAAVAEADEDAVTPTEAEKVEESENTIAPQVQEEATVTDAVESFNAPESHRADIKATAATVAITAGADVPGFSAGTTIDDLDGVAKAMSKRLASVQNARGGSGEQHVVASFSTAYPESRVLGADSQANASKIQTVTEGALVASGGFLAPLEANYDIYGLGSDVRPVRDALPRFQADRGGIRYIKPPQLSSYTGAVGIWTNENDITAAGNTGVAGDLTKNLLVVGGATEATAYTYAVTLQLQFGNLVTRAFPELIKRHNELALIQHARLAEISLLNAIEAESTKVTTTGTIGAARDFLVNLKRAGAAYRSRHRIAVDTKLTAIIPAWVYDAIASDLVLNMPGDNSLDTTRADIDRMLSAANINLVASVDQDTFGAQNNGALLGFPDSFTWFLFSEGSFLFLDGGTLDIGIVRDSALVGTNDYRMFTESFEGVAFVGVESLAVTSTFAVNGAAAALVETAKY